MLLRLDRTAHPDLYDITLKCADNRELRAHKCILIARMEYFQLMFRNKWAETQTVNMTTVPIEFMEPIIDFLYTNDVTTATQGRDYSDNFLYNMIVICDQYFVTDLRSIFELLVIDRISIKKCTEMLEFACSYNCQLLRSVCLDFIVQNAARMLEHRTLNLDTVNDDLLTLISQHYRGDFGPISGCNATVDPLAEALLESFIADFQIDLTYRADGDSATKTTKRKRRTSSTSSQQERRAHEKEAIDSMAAKTAAESADSSVAAATTNKVAIDASAVLLEAEKIASEHAVHVKNWTKVTKNEPRKKPLPMVAAKLNDILANEQKIKDDFYSLNKSVQQQLQSPTSPSSAAAESTNFDISSPSSSFSLSDFTPLSGMKISQKQRKSQSLNLTTPTKAQLPMELLSPTPPAAVSTPIPASAWAVVSPPSTSSAIKSPIASSESPISNRRRSKLSMDEAGSSATDTMPQNFTKILKEERRERDYFEKLKTKSLMLTQIEETAIAELKKFYNIDNVHDENIFVQRCVQVQPTMNFSVWRHQN